MREASSGHKRADAWKGSTATEAAALDAMEAFARTAHEGAGPCHDFSHVQRVLALAERIARSEGADLFIVRAAALLHDCGRKEDSRSGGECDRHEEVSAELAEPLLRRLEISADVAQRIMAAILGHRHRRGRGPEALEDECLYDADKLDSLGAAGVARAYLWLGEWGRGLHYPPSDWKDVDPTDNSVEHDSMQREWAIKLSRLREGMRTGAGRALAEERHERMRRFLEELEEEVAGRL